MSASLFNRAKEIIPGGVNSPVRFYEPYPFFASYGKGSKIITEEHDTLIDYCLGYGSVLLGHAYLDVINAVIRATYFVFLQKKRSDWQS